MGGAKLGVRHHRGRADFHVPLPMHWRHHSLSTRFIEHLLFPGIRLRAWEHRGDSLRSSPAGSAQHSPSLAPLWQLSHRSSRGGTLHPAGQDLNCETHWHSVWQGEMQLSPLSHGVRDASLPSLQWAEQLWSTGSWAPGDACFPWSVSG